MKVIATALALMTIVAVVAAPTASASRLPTAPPCDDLEELQECINDAYDTAQALINYVTQDAVNDTQEIIWCVVNGCIFA